MQIFSYLGLTEFSLLAFSAKMVLFISLCLLRFFLWPVQAPSSKSFCVNRQDGMLCTEHKGARHSHHPCVERIQHPPCLPDRLSFGVPFALCMWDSNLPKLYQDQPWYIGFHYDWKDTVKIGLCLDVQALSSMVRWLFPQMNFLQCQSSFRMDCKQWISAWFCFA